MSKRNEILEIALKLFGASGFQETPTSQIAREAGVATGTLFHHFKTKEELILELYKSIWKEYALYIGKEVRPENAARKNLKSMYINALQWYAAYPDRLKFMLEFESSRFASLIKDDSYADKVTLATFLENGIEQGALLKIPVDLAIGLIQQHLKAVHVYLQRLSLDRVELEERKAASFELLWRMLRNDAI